MGTEITSGVIANIISALIVFIFGLIFLNNRLILKPWIYRIFGIKLSRYFNAVVKFFVHPLLRIALITFCLVILNVGYYKYPISIAIFVLAISLVWRTKREDFFGVSPLYSDDFSSYLVNWDIKTGTPAMEKDFGKPAPDLILNTFSSEATNSFIVHKEIREEGGIIECDFYLENDALFNVVFLADPDLKGKAGTDNWYMARFDSRKRFSDGLLIKKNGPGNNWREFVMSGTQTSPKQWYRARVEFDPRKIAVYKDNELLAELANPNIFGKSIGMFNEVGDVHVDNFTFRKK